MIKAIETEYKGYKFRSRLEARWAVFFDEAGIKYQYEAEGFTNNNQYYLPDFYLPQFDIYVEVKGCAEQFEKDCMDKKYLAICECVHNEGYEFYECKKPILLLTEIPNYENIISGKYCPDFFVIKGFLVNDTKIEIIFDKCNLLPTNNKGPVVIYRSDDYVAINKIRITTDPSNKNKPVIRPGIDLVSKTNYEKMTKSKSLDEVEFIEIDESKQCFKYAYKKARQARFEHGETP